MSRRNTTDPLLREFLDTYKVNLLSIPREGLEVGDTYVAGADGNMSSPGKLRFLLTPEFQVPQVQRAEKLSSIKGRLTRALDLSVGLNLLEGFLSALGADIGIGKIKAEYAHKQVSKVRFQLKDATRDSVDAFEFGKALIPCRLDAKQPYVRDGNHYYAVVGVLRSQSITVSTEDENSDKIELDLDALKGAVAVHGKVGVSRDAAGEITYGGSLPLAFGVELVEMLYDNDQDKFFLIGVTEPQVVRADRDKAERRVFVGDPVRGDVFLPLNTRDPSER
jgi:hypothetical protein